MFVHVPVYALPRALIFPPPDHAVEGLVAVGGDLSVERLLLAYRSGIFPWYDDGLPILWHSPDPRCVFVLDKVHASRSLRKTITRRVYETRFDQAFERVIALGYRHAVNALDKPVAGLALAANPSSATASAARVT